MDKSIPAGAALLLDRIGETEAPLGYGTIYGNNQAKLPKPLTQMKLDEVLAAQPGWSRRYGSSACGRYQFMRNTLKGLKQEMGLSGKEIFSANFQDRLGFRLLLRRGYDEFMSRQTDRVQFGLALAKEWASFPVLKDCKGASRPVKRGQSYYAGDGVNKALVKPEKVEAWLKAALAAGNAADAPAEPPAPPARPEPKDPPAPAPDGKEGEKQKDAPRPRKLRWSTRFWTWLTTGGMGGLLGMREAGLFELDWTFWALVAGVLVALSLIGILTMPEVRAMVSRRIVGLFGAIVALALLPALAWDVGAYAHDAIPTAAAPKGWSYPFSCCSGYDCREVNASIVGEKPEGYVIGYTGEVVPYRDSRVKDSPDGEYHWCSVAGKNDGKTICLFVPPKAF